MNVQKALICIPDINGFTEFMSDTSLGLSAKVIPALLNEIIYSNTIGLKVSEIEGDAVLFYRTGEPPPMRDLIFQCYFFHRKFYQKISELRVKHISNQDSVKIPEMLGLKIIMHYGEIGLNKIGKRIKLIGEDVIIAHRLLKNSVAMPEYMLFSESLVDFYHQHPTIRGELGAEEFPFQKGCDEYDHLGNLSYHFLDIESTDSYI